MDTKEKWIDFMNRTGHVGMVNNYDSIILLYSEQHRFYHTISHINNRLDLLEKHAAICNDLNAIEFAIWYHDIVYDPKSKENEEKSADIFMRDWFFLPFEFKYRVRKLIMATKYDTINDDDFDLSLIQDIDLQILGSDWKTYDQYRCNVRKEFGFIDNKAYSAGRTAFLNKMLARQIYATPIFRRLYEVQAIKNINQEIIELEKV